MPTQLSTAIVPLLYNDRPHSGACPDVCWLGTIANRGYRRVSIPADSIQAFHQKRSVTIGFYRCGTMRLPVVI